MPSPWTATLDSGCCCCCATVVECCSYIDGGYCCDVCVCSSTSAVGSGTLVQCTAQVSVLCVSSSERIANVAWMLAFGFALLLPHAADCSLLAGKLDGCLCEAMSICSKYGSYSSRCCVHFTHAAACHANHSTHNANVLLCLIPPHCLLEPFGGMTYFSRLMCMENDKVHNRPRCDFGIFFFFSTKKANHTSAFMHTVHT